MLPPLPNPLSGLLSLPERLAGALHLPALPPLPFAQTRSNGLSIMASGLGFQSITTIPGGTATFQIARVSWNGLVRNTGNVPLSGATIRLRTILTPSESVIREASASLPTLAPGATAPIALRVDILSGDPPGDFLGVIAVEAAGQRLGQIASPRLGTIVAAPTPTTSVTNYLGQIAAAPTMSALELVRTAFEEDFIAGRLAYTDFLTLFNAASNRAATLSAPAFLVDIYLNEIATATTLTYLEAIARSFSADYFAGRLSDTDVTTLADHYFARQATLSGRPMPYDASLFPTYSTQIAAAASLTQLASILHLFTADWVAGRLAFSEFTTLEAAYFARQTTLSAPRQQLFVVSGPTVTSGPIYPAQPLSSAWIVGNRGNGVGIAQAALTITGFGLVAEGAFINVPPGGQATVDLTWTNNLTPNVYTAITIVLDVTPGSSATAGDLSASYQFPLTISAPIPNRLFAVGSRVRRVIGSYTWYGSVTQLGSYDTNGWQYYVVWDAGQAGNPSNVWVYESALSATTVPARLFGVGSRVRWVIGSLSFLGSVTQLSGYGDNGWQAYVQFDPGQAGNPASGWFWEFTLSPA